MFEEIETYPVYCGSTCGHFDFLNQCCWLSWRNKEEDDHCNYGLEVTADNVIFTPKELSEFKEDSESQGMEETTK